jgi:hypothetical protein
VLALGIIVVVLVVTVAVVFALRRRSHDDVHSVEGYHRQLHTLEVLRTHPPGQEDAGGDGASLPQTAFRVATSTTVRLTEPGKPIVPPVPPPPVADPDKPVTFDDAGPVITTPPRDTSSPGTHSRKDDKALQGINHRPRRLAAPAAAVAAVLVVIVVLVVTGIHSVPPAHHHTSASGAHGTTTPGHRTSARRHHHTVTTTTVAPVVSLPRATSPTSAVYAVGPNTYSLAMSATTGECWVQATEASSGTVLFSGMLNPGQTQTVSATGAVSLIVGAPNSFAANINGTSVSFPFGYQAPFTMQFLVAPGNQT